jgi:hypothetical protein
MSDERLERIELAQSIVVAQVTQIIRSTEADAVVQPGRWCVCLPPASDEGPVTRTQDQKRSAHSD